jgi:hypothetical protein
MKRLIFILLAWQLVLSSCIKSPKYDEGTFPAKPVNMAEFNTEKNDYNSAIPPSLIDVFPLLFSSDRNGEDYDIVRELVEITFDRDNGKLNLDNRLSESLDLTRSYSVLGKIPGLINTGANEYGPYIMEYHPAAYDKYDGLFRVLYANDQSGSLDIYYTTNYENRDDFSTPMPVKFLNTEFDDAYPTFNELNNVIYFTSNRGGNFDIYSVPISGDTDMALNDSTPALITKEMILSSDHDDKCPYIQGDLLVFTSNRPGGFGGFDLYYSKREGNHWSQPVNFGPAINTEKDEYRPVVARFNYYTNNLMIFSSNRDGGKGGFDLYYVGISIEY